MSQKRIGVLLVVVLAALLALAGAPADVQAQDAEVASALPPRVIDIFPLPGVELGLNEALTVTFDQPMDRPSVEAALSLSPLVTGGWSWVDARTLRFSPDVGWGRGATYALQIDNTARTVEGVPLVEPVNVEIATVGTLTVASVSPEDDTADVAADARIVLTFDRPVVPLGSTADQAGLPSPIQISPALEGSGAWVNTSMYVFEPTEGLAGSTTYTVSVQPGLTSIDGALLEQGYQWAFTTKAPEILSIQPTFDATTVPLDTPVVVTFSQAMQTASAEAAFSLALAGDPVAGTFGWNDDFTIMTFSPAGRLSLESTYTIAVDDTARSFNGVGTLIEGQQAQFTTVPFPNIVETAPFDGETEVYLGRQIAVRFNAPMNPNTLEGRISISPDAGNWLPVIYDYDPQRLTLQELTLQTDTTYTIQIAAGVEDVYGNAIASPFAFSFTTEGLRDEAYPIINGDFMITSAYREDTRFDMMIIGDVNSIIEVYRVADITDIDAATFTNYSDYVSRGGDNPYAFTEDGQLAPWAEEANVVRRFSTDFAYSPTRTPYPVLLASDDGGQLDPGLYWVNIYANAPNRWMGEVYQHQFALTVATANIIVKRAPEETLVWVIDIASGQPVGSAAVEIYNGTDLIAEGETDADGVFRTPVSLPEGNEQIRIVAQNDNAFGAWFSSQELELPTERGYLYTDRPVYRPGETVYYRGVLRERRDMDYRVPDLGTVNLRIGSPWDEDLTYYEGTAELTEFGSFSGEFVIPMDAEFGDVAITAEFGDGKYYSNYEYWDYNWRQQRSSQVVFTVTEFRVPEYEVTVTAQDEAIILGETTDVLVSASYYSGGAVSEVSSEVYISAEQTGFTYEGHGRYTFVDSFAFDDYFSTSFSLDPLLTNFNGQALAAVGGTITPSTPRPVAITVDASIADESGFPVAGRTTLIQHPAAMYVGVGTDSYFGDVGTSSAINLITVSPDSVPLPDSPVELEIEQVEWVRQPIEGQFGSYDWVEEVTPVLSETVVTAADGTAVYDFTPTDAGSYRIRARVQDAQGRLNQSSRRLYVLGDSPIWWRPPSNNVEMIADRDSYRPGDTARIIIPLPFEQPSTVLVTTERADVMMHEVLPVEGTSLVYDLPITDAYAPTVYFAVTILRGTDADNPNPDYATGRLTLTVEPVNDRIMVEVEPSSTINPPRGDVSFDLRATDANGDPVQAEIGVALTDEAVLALMPPNSATLEDSFYGQQDLYISTDVSLVGLLDRLTDGVFPAGYGGGGGGGGGDSILIREDFEYTPLWLPHVVTDAEGEATVSVTLPDNLTRWKFDARAVTLTTAVGQVEAQIVSTLPLIVRPVAPRFFVVGDRVALAAIINNHTDVEQVIEARLESTGVTLESPDVQTVTVPSNGRVRVEWMAVVEDVAGVDLTFFAVGDEVQDAAKPALRTGEDDTIPVYRFSAPDVVGTGGFLNEVGAAVEGVSLPTRYSDFDGQLNISLDPSLAASTVDSLNYLQSYPHQCTEQIVSRFLPNAVTYRALRDLGIEDEALRENLTVVVGEALTRLAADQKADGGWGWFASFEDSDPYVTAYALLGLIEAQDAGFAVDADMLARALRYVSQQVQPVDLSASPYTLNSQAFFLYVLARAEQTPALADFQAMVDQRLRMSYGARAYLLMALDAAHPDETGMIDLLVSDLTSAAVLSANGAHWEETERDWLSWTSDTRTTALSLTALLRVDAENPLLPNVVRWLMTARQGDHWQTTQETVWSVLGLTDWMIATGELEGSYDYLAQINDELLAQAQVTPGSVREGAQYSIDVNNLLTETVNRLTISRGDGTGALYYTAYLDLNLPAAEVEPLDRGVYINREYFINGGRFPLSDARVGDVITVRLTVTLREDVYYFVLEDPLPSGMEQLNPDLQTTSIATAEPMLETIGEDEFWFWRWWLFDRTEQRDEMTALYADFLPAGTYVYSYQVQAAIPGEFQAMPAHGYAFYLPEVFGRSAGQLFTVSPEGSPAG